MGNPNNEIDHIDRNTKNNRKSNLRLASRQEQMYNTLKIIKQALREFILIQIDQINLGIVNFNIIIKIL